MSNQIPITLITGFLGAGKTTLLNSIINTTQKKVALILNEFGDIKLESQFIEKNGIKTAELANGCMCCIAKSDIPRVIKLVLEQEKEIDHILIEASGLSDPDPIHQVIAGELSNQVQLQHTICIIDCLNFEKTRQEHQIVLSQLADADVVVLSKITVAGPKKTNAIEAFIKQITFNTKVIQWDDQFIPSQLLESSKPNMQSQNNTNPIESHHDSEQHHDTYQEFWYKDQSKIFTQPQVETIFTKLPEEIIRAKGYININHQKFMVQYSMGVLNLSHKPDPNWQQDTAILYIGKSFDKDVVKELFQSI